MMRGQLTQSRCGAFCPLIWISAWHAEHVDLKKSEELESELESSGGFGIATCFALFPTSRRCASGRRFGLFSKFEQIKCHERHVGDLKGPIKCFFPPAS